MAELVYLDRGREEYTRTLALQQRQQQLLDREELMAQGARLAEGLVQAELEFTG